MTAAVLSVPKLIELDASTMELNGVAAAYSSNAGSNEICPEDSRKCFSLPASK
jgi:hypothetical protein